SRSWHQIFCQTAETTQVDNHTSPHRETAARRADRGKEAVPVGVQKVLHETIDQDAWSNAVLTVHVELEGISVNRVTAPPSYRTELLLIKRAPFAQADIAYRGTDLRDRAVLQKAAV